MRVPASREVRRRDRIYGGHVVLALLLCAWRMLRTTPGIAVWSGGELAESPAGRLLALASVILGVVALVAVALLSIREWRDPKVLALLVLLALSASMRKTIDVFDIVYVAAVAILAVIWFQRDRARCGLAR